MKGFYENERLLKLKDKEISYVKNSIEDYCNRRDAERLKLQTALLKSELKNQKA